VWYCDGRIGELVGREEGDKWVFPQAASWSRLRTDPIGRGAVMHESLFI
jgi:hypothetical protein